MCLKQKSSFFFFFITKEKDDDTRYPFFIFIHRFALLPSFPRCFFFCKLLHFLVVKLEAFGHRLFGILQPRMRQYLVNGDPYFLGHHYPVDEVSEGAAELVVLVIYINEGVTSIVVVVLHIFYDFHVAFSQKRRSGSCDNMQECAQ